MFLLLYVLNVFQVLFKIKQLFRNSTQRSALGLDSYEWVGQYGEVPRTADTSTVLELHP